MKQYMERILELLESGMTKADIARQIIQENNLTTTPETMRVNVSRAIKNTLTMVLMRYVMIYR